MFTFLTFLNKNAKTLLACNFATPGLVIQVYVIPLWKALISGCLEIGVQGRGSMFRVCHFLLKNAILLHKMASELKHL